MFYYISQKNMKQNNDAHYKLWFYRETGNFNSRSYLFRNKIMMQCRRRMESKGNEKTW